MTKTHFSLFALLLLISCSGETYDTSKAVSITPETTDSLIINSSLTQKKILIDEPYYQGEFQKNKIAKLKGLSSNVEITKNFIFYIKKNKYFVKMNQENKKEYLFFGKSLKKIKNIKFNLITLRDKNALVVSSSGDVLLIDTEKMELKWSYSIQDITTVKPIIANNEAIVPTSSGAIFVFNLKDGKLISRSGRVDDVIGINFNLISNLSAKKFIPGNFFLSYYKNVLLFFDLTNFNKIYSLSLGDQLIDFKKINATPVFYKNFILAPTSSKLVSVSLANGIKVWSINGNFESNVDLSDNFAFAFEKNTKSIIAVSIENGNIKWKFDTSSIFKNSKKVWIGKALPNVLIAINDKGHYIKLNISNGEILSYKVKNGFYSPLFDYQIVDNKIYYTDVLSVLTELK